MPKSASPAQLRFLAELQRSVNDAGRIPDGLTAAQARQLIQGLIRRRRLQRPTQRDHRPATPTQRRELARLSHAAGKPVPEYRMTVHEASRAIRKLRKLDAERAADPPHHVPPGSTLPRTTNDPY